MKLKSIPEKEVWDVHSSFIDFTWNKMTSSRKTVNSGCDGVILKFSFWKFTTKSVARESHLFSDSSNEKGFVNPL